MIKYSIKLYNYKKNLQQNNSKCLNRKIIASNLSIRYKEKIKPLFIKDPRPVHFRCEAYIPRLPHLVKPIIRWLNEGKKKREKNSKI